MDRLNPRRTGQDVADLMLSSPVKIDIYCGHHHTVHDQEIRNVRQHVTPGNFHADKEKKGM